MVRLIRRRCCALGVLAVAQLRIVVNVPAYRLDAYVNDSTVMTARIAVGQPAYPTPRGQFVVTSVEWNPWWIPPDRPWAARERPTPPGPSNPMGAVKINFRPLYFLHGTPLEQSIGSAASHGCIRMHNQDAVALARLVHRFGTPGVTSHEVDSLLARRQPRSIAVTETVTVDIRYDLVEFRRDSIAVYRDVYHLAREPLAGAIVRALAEHGVDTSRLDRARVGILASRVPAGGNATALAALLRPER